MRWLIESPSPVPLALILFCFVVKNGSKMCALDFGGHAAAVVAAGDLDDVGRFANRNCDFAAGLRCFESVGDEVEDDLLDLRAVDVGIVRLINVETDRPIAELADVLENADRVVDDRGHIVLVFLAPFAAGEIEAVVR